MRRRLPPSNGASRFASTAARALTPERRVSA
jgi:hypothetical protein